MRLDAKDRRILYELEYHVRQPVSEIARHVRLPKQVASYRIKRLIEEGVIRGFREVVDIHRLGYFSYRVYLRLQNISPTEEKELYGRIAELKNLFWFVLTTGSYDAQVMFVARNNVHFNSLLSELKRILGERLKEYIVSPSITTNHFRKKYLVENWKPEDISPAFGLETGMHRIDRTDFEILHALSRDASMTYRQLGGRIGLSDNGVKKRMKGLENAGIIKSYRTWLDLDKLGRQYYKALISVRHVDEKLEKGIISFCMTEPSIIYFVVCTGSWEVELEAEVKDEYEFRDMLFRFRSRFKDVVGDYDILHVYKEIKMVYFPFDSYDDFEKSYEVKWVGMSRP
jgi:DNA-binding Lrp family transcriptional regulator